MKKLSIIQQIIVTNLIVMFVFMSIFLINNYFVMSKQLSKVADEKVSAIMETIVPLMAINLALGLEENYKDILDDTLKKHDEFVSLSLVNKKLILYQIEKVEPTKNTKHLEIEVFDALTNVKSATLYLNYGESKLYKVILRETVIFHLGMILLFLSTLWLLIYLLKQNFQPLKALVTNVSNYKLENIKIFSKLERKDEVSLINNTIVEMLEKIELEVKLKVYYEQMVIKKERQASMGEMLDNVAHQWRQPLMKINAILLNMDLNIQKNNINREYFEDKVDEISETLDDMSKTIYIFREFISPNKVVSKFNVVKAIQDTILIVNSSLKAINIVLDFDEEYEVLGVKNEFSQVIVCLINNAIEALESREVSEPKINIEIKSMGDKTLIIIEDNAKGIEENIIEKVFDLYFTTKYKIGGTGLGLHLCKKIAVEGFNGDISVVNGLMGARFTFEIKESKIEY